MVACSMRTDLAATEESKNPLWRWQTFCEDFGPVCDLYEPIVDQNGLSVEYNFTWWGTRLYPLTYGTDAFDSFLERPSFFQNR